MIPEVFRHESFLLTLPFNAALPDAYIQHFKDAPGAPATPGWEDFDLNTYLGLGGDRLPQDIPSTTLMFKLARGEPVRPWETVEEAWPRVFQWHRSSQSLPRRLLTARWIRVTRDLVRPPELRASMSVVQAIRLAPRPNSEPDEWRWRQLDRALGHLNDLLSGVAMVRRDPEISSVGLRDLPPLVLGFGWELHSDGRRSQVEWRGYKANDRLPWVSPTMSGEEAELAGWIAAAKDDPLKPAGEFLLGAWSSAQRGRFTHAVTEAGTAVELLISASLRVAAPHHGYSKERVGRILDGDFAGRVRHHFAPMFGYATDPGRSIDALGRWWQDTYLLRNRVVHSGHRPTEAEAVQAIEAAEDLHNDFAGRVSADPRLHALHHPIPPEVIAAAEQHGLGPVPRSFERLRRPS